MSHQGTKRDFLFIDDFTNLLLKILNDFPEGYKIYNVGYGKSHSLEEIIKIIEKIVNLKIHIQYDKSIRPNDITEMVADITKVTKSFDWKPLTSIEEGLRFVLKSYRL